MELIIKLDDDIAKGIRGENECEVEPREIGCKGIGEIATC